uniref:Profilin n=1 Tax=Nothobranchius furzeri TaxID=105023 RepID=A0A8C6M5N2_NOTFU
MLWFHSRTVLQQVLQQETIDDLVTSRSIGLHSADSLLWFQQPDEIKKLVGDRSGFGQNGVFIAGQRCRLIRDQLDVDPIFTLDLKTAADADGNAYGICVGKSKTAIVIVKGIKDATGGQLSSKLYSVVEYLRKSNY